MPLHPEIYNLLGVSESMGTCPFCCKTVESGDDYHMEEVNNSHSDDPMDTVIGLAYVHDLCTAWRNDQDLAEGIGD